MDFLLLVLMVLFFVVSIQLVHGCEKLRKQS